MNILTSKPTHFCKLLLSVKYKFINFKSTNKTIIRQEKIFANNYLNHQWKKILLK